MNIPGITKALELDDEDWQLAVKLRGLSEHQREQFSTALGPAKPQKKPGKKGAGGGIRCAYVYGSGVPCNRMAATTVHVNNQHVDYHQFQPPKSGSKSPRASGMAAAISNSLESSRKATGLKAAMTFCAKPDCGLNQSSDIHDAAAGYAGYHEFQPPQQAEAAAGSGG